MKKFLFLCFFAVSYFSIGQVNNTTTNTEPVTGPVQKQQISKVNKIDKRIKPVRAKRSATPATNKELIKKD